MHAPGQADLNLYAYVRGYVLKSVDPLGLEDESLISPAIPSYGSGGLDEMMANLDALQAELDGEPAPVAADEIPEAQQLAYLNQARTQAAEEHARGDRATPSVDEVQAELDIISAEVDAAGIGSPVSTGIDLTSAGVDAVQGQGRDAGARTLGAIVPFLSAWAFRLAAKGTVREGAQTVADAASGPRYPTALLFVAEGRVRQNDSPMGVV